MNIEIIIPGDEEYDFLNNQLVAFNRSKIDWESTTFVVALKARDGTIRGGARYRTYGRS